MSAINCKREKMSGHLLSSKEGCCKMLKIHSFGSYLQRLREEKELTQNYIADSLQIAEKTYRRIEKNKAIPRIEILEKMSLIFKEDLVLSFVKYNSQGMEMFEKIKEDLEKKIVQDNFEKMNETIPKLKSLIGTIKNPYYILQYQQYILLIEGIVLYREGKNYHESLNKFKEGIDISNENFSIDHYRDLSYSSMEFRLLMNMAFSFYRMGDHDKYCEILEFIIEGIDLEDEIYPTVASNLGNAYKRSKKYSDAIAIMDKGIDYCKKKSDFSMLPLLYYGKGVSQYYLNRNSYKNSFKKAVSLTEMLGYNELETSMKRKCKNNFKYDVAEEMRLFFDKE